MAIDSSLFAKDLPAGTYALGDTVSLGCITGPATVRSGRGSAILKRITCGKLTDLTAANTSWKIIVKNSDWIDPIISLTDTIRSATAMDTKSGCVQSGNNCPLTPNSSWEVLAVCTGGGTTTVANSIFALIDVDYPSVSSITDPDTLTGIPTTIEHSHATLSTPGLGKMETSGWVVDNVDFFKAGYEYALAKIEMTTFASCQGFIAIANAAGMGGLQRIIPIDNNPSNIRNTIEYATKLQKGPMDIKFFLFANAAADNTSNTTLLLDFVKRKI